MRYAHRQRVIPGSLVREGAKSVTGGDPDRCANTDQHGSPFSLSSGQRTTSLTSGRLLPEWPADGLRQFL